MSSSVISFDFTSILKGSYFVFQEIRFEVSVYLFFHPVLGTVFFRIIFNSLSVSFGIVSVSPSGRSMTVNMSFIVFTLASNFCILYLRGFLISDSHPFISSAIYSDMKWTVKLEMHWSKISCLVPWFSYTYFTVFHFLFTFQERAIDFLKMCLSRATQRGGIVKNGWEFDIWTISWLRLYILRMLKTMGLWATKTM